MRIENVDWQLTSQCNRMCPYCFGPDDTNDLPLSDAKRIIDILAKMGAKQIGLTGGEPLLYPRIAELIEYIVDKGIRIYLSSNCDYYSEFAHLIKRKVSILGVPLDGSSAVTHDPIRGKGSFQNITSAIADIGMNRKNHIFPLSTILNSYEQIWQYGTPSTLNHDSTRFAGWNFLSGIYMEPGKAYVTNRIYIPEKQHEYDQLQKRNHDYLYKHYYLDRKDLFDTLKANNGDKMSDHDLH